MKNQIKFSLITLSLIFSGILVTNFSIASNYNYSLTLKTQVLMANGNVFSWKAAPNAVNYDVIITNQSNQQSSFQQTVQTEVSLAGLPSGTYGILVKANYANGTSGIIVEDVIQL